MGNEQHNCTSDKNKRSAHVFEKNEIFLQVACAIDGPQSTESSWPKDMMQNQKCNKHHTNTHTHTHTHIVFDRVSSR
jgi:hypothetical protein